MHMWTSFPAKLQGRKGYKNATHDDGLEILTLTFGNDI